MSSSHCRTSQDPVSECSGSLKTALGWLIDPEEVEIFLIREERRGAKEKETDGDKPRQ